MLLFYFDIGKEIRRLWINWLFFILLGAVNFITLLSTLPTLHQFVTNPRSEILNSTQTSLKVSNLEADFYFKLYYPYYHLHCTDTTWTWPVRNSVLVGCCFQIYRSLYCSIVHWVPIESDSILASESHQSCESHYRLDYLCCGC